jgi:hypothetical protein
MAVVQNTYTGNGSTVLYSLSFPYLDQTDVKVSVNGSVVTNYIFATASSIQFLTAPANGAAIRIYRETDNEETKATIFPGSAIKAQDLNANFSQTLYSVQEIAFRALSKFGDTMLGILNMGGFKITNLGTPTSSTDASTKSYVDGVIATGAANAAAAAASASAAAGSASSAAATYDAFDDRYLGSKPTDPALDNDGNALITGAIYFNTSSNVMRVYNGATWQDASANANVLRWRKTAVGGETSLSGADDNAATLTYTVNLEFVYLNGVLLQRGVDYTASNGTSIDGLVALEAGDVVEVLSYSSFSLLSAPSSSITFTQNGSGAVVRTVDSKLKDVVSVKDFGAVGDGVTNDQFAIQAAINHISSTAPFSGTVYFPPGTYRVLGVDNGHNPATNGNTAILIPFADFGTNKNITLDGGGSARILLDSTNSYAIRASRVGTVVKDLKIDSTSKDNTVGIGIVEENRGQLTTVVSQNYCKVIGCTITGFQEGIIIEPGPTVGASGSGAYYPIIDNCDFNLNCRAIWTKASIQDPTNRPTRGTISNCRIERGHTGIDFDYCTEFAVISCFGQFLNGNYPTAFNPYTVGTESFLRLGTLTEYCTLFGGEAEACTYDIYNTATNGSALYVSGFTLGGVNYQISDIPIVDRIAHRVSREGAGNQQLSYVFQNNGFARIVGDYDAANLKTLSVETNGIERFRWFNGTTTHYGSTGNVVMSATGELSVGNNIKFPATQVSSAGPNVLDDYEEGTFTPSIVGATTPGTATYSIAQGYYTKIGNLVTATLTLDWSSHTGTGAMRISGLPFTSSNAANNYTAICLRISGINIAADYIAQGISFPNSSQILLYQYTGGSPIGQSTVSVSAAGTITATISYKV